MAVTLYAYITSFSMATMLVYVQIWTDSITATHVYHRKYINSERRLVFCGSEKN